MSGHILKYRIQTEDIRKGLGVVNTEDQMKQNV